MVPIGDGGRHRVVFGARSGTLVGECDCTGHSYHGWCAHVAAVFLAYIRDEVVVDALASFGERDEAGGNRLLTRAETDHETSYPTEVIADEAQDGMRDTATGTSDANEPWLRMERCRMAAAHRAAQWSV